MDKQYSEKLELAFQFDNSPNQSEDDQTQFKQQNQKDKQVQKKQNIIHRDRFSIATIKNNFFNSYQLQVEENSSKVKQNSNKYPIVEKEQVNQELNQSDKFGQKLKNMELQIYDEQDINKKEFTLKKQVCIHNLQFSFPTQNNQLEFDLNLSDEEEQNNKQVQKKNHQISAEENQKNRYSGQKQLKNIKFSSFQDQTRNILQELSEGQRFLTIIKRDTSGLNTFWPELELLAAQNLKRMIFCEKKAGCTTSNYHFTIDLTNKDTNNTQLKCFIGKLRSNFSGSLYNIFDNGLRPTSEMYNKNYTIRSILATIKFKNQIFTNQPRQFEVFVLKTTCKYHELHGIILNEEISLDKLYEIKQNQQKMYYFRNRRPIYCGKLNGFMLNFNGRVHQSSIKNFIVEEPQSGREIMMLGKVKQDLYRLDISYPLSPFIAFCIAMSNFDSKYICD